MNTTLYLVMRFLHILFMAAWVGAAFFISSDLRKTLSTAGANTDLLAERLRRYNRIAAGAGTLTIVTGFALIFTLGGFKVVPKVIHISIVLAVVMMGVGGAMIGRNSKVIVNNLSEGQSLESQLPNAKKVSIGVGIFHTLWFVTLALMVFRTMLF